MAVTRPTLDSLEVEEIELSIVAEAVCVRAGVVIRLPSTVVGFVKPPSAVVVAVL